uniref:Uncharacterized protein n=1 Tax=Arundo donax TaxID=35708 RepID=A0A0A9FFL3_ARUDO
MYLWYLSSRFEEMEI